MNVDPVLVAQVGAFLGTTVVLYLATTPTEEVQKSRAMKRSVPAQLSSECLSSLSGAKRYAPRYRKQASMGRDESF